MTKKAIFKKAFVQPVFDYPNQFMSTEGMYLAVKRHTNNMSAYIRSLIQNDLKIDEHGKKVKEEPKG